MGQQSLEAVNQRLKAGRVGVTVRRRGNRLALRATLPPKPGSGKDRPHQQDISLGIYANPKGLERAEDEAKKLGVQLTQKEFDWGNWGMPRPPTPKTSRDWVESFKTSYFRTHQLSESTWQKHWQTYFNRLPLERPLTGTLLVAVALSTSENTRARKECCKKFQKLADFAGVDCDLIQYQGRYSTGRMLAPVSYHRMKISPHGLVRFAIDRGHGCMEC